MKSDSDLLIIIKDAAEGLLFPSEIDVPFEVEIRDRTEGVEISSDTVSRLTGKSEVNNITEISLETLFSTPTLEQDWHSPEDKEKVRRFRNLHEAINTNLKEVTVYKFGKINIDVVILGRTPSGNLMFITTKLLQT